MRDGNIMSIPGVHHENFACSSLIPAKFDGPLSSDCHPMWNVSNFFGERLLQRVVNQSSDRRENSPTTRQHRCSPWGDNREHEIITVGTNRPRFQIVSPPRKAPWYELISPHLVPSRHASFDSLSLPITCCLIWSKVCALFLCLETCRGCRERASWFTYKWRQCLLYHTVGCVILGWCRPGVCGCVCFFSPACLLLQSAYDFMAVLTLSDKFSRKIKIIWLILEFVAGVWWWDVST